MLRRLTDVAFPQGLLSIAENGQLARRDGNLSQIR